MEKWPMLLTLPDAATYIGFSRTRLYSVLHRLDVRKAGRRTLITRTSLDRFIEALPKKYIEAPKSRQ